jgi:RNA polymerase sigma factor (sigma-70 family)
VSAELFLTTEQKRAFLAAIEQEHGRPLRRFLAARMRNANADVSDLVQEVYLRLLRIEDHETIRNPQAYLYTVASHVLHQYTLRQATIPQSMDPQDVVSALRAVPDTDPALGAEFEQRFEELGQALQRLSPRAYATLVMHRCDGVPLKEIGERLGVSRTMVKRYLARALSFCQQRLQDESE